MTSSIEMARDQFEQVRETIRQRMIERDVPSVALAVAQEGRIVWQEGFGWADRENRLAANEHIAYPLASVTKPLTATAIMRLVELGQLDLDMPVNHYLHADCQMKVWLADADELTVRRLANHTGGLTTHSNPYHAGDRVGLPAKEESIRRYGQAVTIPGERYRYSNFGYGILDHLVARVSGLSFGDFLQREVFAPLGMHRSAIGVPEHMAGFAAAPYNDDQQRLPVYPSDHAGASDGYASAHDLLRFGLFHLKQPLPDQKRILSDALLDEMQRPTAGRTNGPPTDLNLRPQSSYGVGWVIDQTSSPRRISHGGGMDGCATKLLLLPDEQIVIAVVSNVFDPLAYQIEDDILEAMLPSYVWRPDEKPTARSAAPDASALAPLRGEWVGQIHTYERRMPMTLSVRASGDLHARVGQQQTALVNGVTFEDDWLSGTLAGMIETADANRKFRHPFHHLQLDLRHRGDRLTGAVVGIAGQRLGHWVELRRCDEAGDQSEVSQD